MAAEKQPSSLTTIRLVGIATIGIMMLLVPILTSDDLEEPAALVEPIEEPMASEGLTAEEPERLPIPRGLKGLRFGATIDQARAALPDAEWDDQPFITIHEELGESTPPGSYRQCDTTIGTQEATCDLHFSVNNRLSAMRCRVHADREVYGAVLAAILETLVNNHGAAHRHWNEDGPIGILRDSGWVWEDEHARLELLSTMRGIVVGNTSQEHRDALAKRKADTARAAARAARDEARETQRKLDEIEKSKSAFDRDL